jgi:hypothetical protein
MKLQVGWPTSAVKQALAIMEGHQEPKRPVPLPGDVLDTCYRCQGSTWISRDQRLQKELHGGEVCCAACFPELQREAAASGTPVDIRSDPPIAIS